MKSETNVFQVILQNQTVSKAYTEWLCEKGIYWHYFLVTINENKIVISFILYPDTIDQVRLIQRA